MNTIEEDRRAFRVEIDGHFTVKVGFSRYLAVYFTACRQLPQEWRLMFGALRATHPISSHARPFPVSCCRGAGTCLGCMWDLCHIWNEKRRGKAAGSRVIHPEFNYLESGISQKGMGQLQGLFHDYRSPTWEIPVGQIRINCLECERRRQKDV